MVGLARSDMLESHEAKREPGSDWEYTVRSYGTNLAPVHCWRKDARLIVKPNTPWSRI
jgi:hypothetical protein